MDGLRRDNFRLVLSSLASRAPVSVGGVVHSPVELARTLAVDLERRDEASAETPQMVAELGRETAAALYAVQRAEAEYRVWRDGQIHRVTNSVSAAAEAGFECASSPGTDSKGKEKEAKTPPTSAAEVWLRTLPEYMAWQERQARAQEAYHTLQAALDAAKLRIRALESLSRAGGSVDVGRRELLRVEPEASDDGDGGEYQIQRFDDGEPETHESLVDRARAQRDKTRQGSAMGGAVAGPPLPPPPPPFPGRG